MTLDELDKQITKMDRIQELRQIELNKLRAYYWVLETFKIKAEEIKSISYRPGQDKSFVEMKSDDKYSQEFIECKGNLHNILMGLDTSYDKEKG